MEGNGILRFLRRLLFDPVKRSKQESKENVHSLISSLDNQSFGAWVSLYDLVDDQKLSLYREKLHALTTQPKISVILPVYNTNSEFLEQAIESVLSQIYQNWELCIVDDASDQGHVKEILNKYQNADKRIKIYFSKSNNHISVASNKAIEISTGQFICMLDHDDKLRQHSLLFLAEAISKNPSCKLIYTDEDKIDVLGNRSGPYFKPAWNPDLLLSQNYICHLLCISRDCIRQVGGFREGYEGSQDWDLCLRITESISESEIIHIPHILYHWRKSKTSTASALKSKDYVLESARKTLTDTLLRRKINGNVISSNSKFSYWRVRRDLPLNIPLVSILIPTRDGLKFLRKCVDSILDKTSYRNFEIIILNNETSDLDCLEYLAELKTNSQIKVIDSNGSFNYSKINNFGVSHANGEIIALLNNDIEVVNEDWLTEMVSHAVRDEIGCVGAKLLYPNDTIQHAGVILGLGGVAGHAYKGFPKEHPGQLFRLHLTQNFEAVTAACLLVKKSIFLKVGGLDEEKLKVAFNDVDFCLKVRNLGYRNLWTPFAVLYHHESVSRGSDETPKNKKRFMTEVKEMKRKWSNRLVNDPTYNPNLTNQREDFSLAFPPNFKVL